MSVSWDDLVKDAGDVGGYEPLPESDYDMVVHAAKFKPSSTGKKMWEITAKVQGGPYNGRQVWTNLVVTPDNPNALAMFFRKMGALGLTTDFFKSQPTDDQVSTALQGRQFRAHVGQRTWNGEKRNEIEKFFPAMTGAVPGLPAATAPVPAAAAAPPPPPAPAPAPAPVAAAPPAAPAPIEYAAPPLPPAPAPAPAVPEYQAPAAAVVPPAPAPPAPTPEPVQVEATPVAAAPPASPF